MYNYFAIIRNWIVFAGCFLLLFSGCDKQSDTPESKRIISKKIAVGDSLPPKAGAREKEIPGQSPQATPGVAPPAPEQSAPPPVGPPEAETSAPPASLPEKEPTLPAGAEKEAAEAQQDATALLPGGKKEEPAGPSVPIAKKTGDVAYAYNPTGKIDPFAPIFREKAESAPASEKTEGKPVRKPMTPLEKIALSQLKLVAVMIAPSGNKALVEEVSGKGYIIHEGTYIGTDSGRVLSILLDKVVVEEEVEDVLGNLTLKKTEMKLQKTPGE